MKKRHSSIPQSVFHWLSRPFPATRTAMARASPRTFSASTADAIRSSSENGWLIPEYSISKVVQFSEALKLSCFFDRLPLTPIRLCPFPLRGEVERFQSIHLTNDRHEQHQHDQ